MSLALGSDALTLDQSSTSIQILPEPVLVTWHVFYKITTLIQRMFNLKVGCNFINILSPLCKQLVDSAQRSGIVGISRNLFHEKSWLSRVHRLFFNQSFLCRTDWTFALRFIEQYFISCYNIIFWLIYVGLFQSIIEPVTS